MTLLARFAVVSDLHIALPHTIWDSPARFHLVEVSIPSLEQILTQLEAANPDFLLLPGDLVQHGERENHRWLAQRLAQLPFPTYVVPGNHDVIRRSGCDRTISLEEFTHQYAHCGYDTPGQPYYRREIAPGLQLIGLNSNGFDADGEPFYSGWLDAAQLTWLDQQLHQLMALNPRPLTLVMVHHNGLEHLPRQANSPMGQRYMIKNADALIQRLHQAQIPLLFTGHLHVQDIASSERLYEVTTGSLVSYPHPYRLCELHQDAPGVYRLQVSSERIRTVPDWPDLQHASREWMAERSLPFVTRLLTSPPLNLSPELAAEYAPRLRHFWAAIADGDTYFNFPDFPVELQQYLQEFNVGGIPIDNQATLALTSSLALF